MLERDRRRARAYRAAQRAAHKEWRAKQEKWANCPNSKPERQGIKDGTLLVAISGTFKNPRQKVELICTLCKSTWQVHTDARHP